jgi:hypothetical protein
MMRSGGIPIFARRRLASSASALLLNVDVMVRMDKSSVNDGLVLHERFKRTSAPRPGVSTKYA